jgi:Predicted integral membrane protein (DUF2269)
MPTPAVAFFEIVLAVHIMAAVVAFGVTFAYPIIFAVIEKADPRALPAVHRAQLAIGQRLIQPGLGVVLIAGIYLASKLHEWSAFYVQWGLGVSIVLGALGGLFFTPTERNMIELSEHDIAAAGDGEVTLGEGYRAAARRVAQVGSLSSVLILATVYFMVTHTGS